MQNSVIFPELPDFTTMNAKARIVWYNEHYPLYLDILLDRLQSFFSSHALADTTIGNNYFANEVLEYISKIADRSKNAYPILALLSYVGATTPGTSCHQFALSEDRPVNVFGKTEYFLDLFAAAPSHTQEKVLIALNQHTEAYKNPLYILKSRCAEIGATSGIPVSEYIRQRFSNSMTNLAICTKFLDAEFGLDVNFTERFEVSLNYALYRVASYLAVVEGISIDYLILQDYSHVATLHGSPLDDSLKKALSSYLFAAPTARTDAFGILLYPSLF